MDCEAVTRGNATIWWMNRRESTAQHYRERIATVIERVHYAVGAGSDEMLSPVTMARLARFSPHHFSRVFSAVVGESISQFVRRLRLERAARQLRDTDDQIIQIAMRAGYSAHGPFTRAFRAQFQVSPSEYRAHPSPTSILSPAPSGIHLDRALPPDGAVLGNDGWSISPITIRDLTPLPLIGTPLPGGYEAVPHEVHRLIDRCDAHAADPAPEIIGIVRDDVPIDAIGMHLAIPAQAPAEIAASIPQAVPFTRSGGAYAVGVFPGPYRELDETYAWLYQVWAARSEYTIDNRPPFEVYLNDPLEVAPYDVLTAVYMPVIRPAAPREKARA